MTRGKVQTDRWTENLLLKDIFSKKNTKHGLWQPELLLSSLKYAWHHCQFCLPYIRDSIWDDSLKCFASSQLLRLLHAATNLTASVCFTSNTIVNFVLRQLGEIANLFCEIYYRGGSCLEIFYSGWESKFSLAHSLFFFLIPSLGLISQMHWYEVEQITDCL